MISLLQGITIIIRREYQCLLSNTSISFLSKLSTHHNKPITNDRSLNFVINLTHSYNHIARHDMQVNYSNDEKEGFNYSPKITVPWTTIAIMTSDFATSNNRRSELSKVDLVSPNTNPFTKCSVRIVKGILKHVYYIQLLNNKRCASPEYGTKRAMN